MWKIRLEDCRRNATDGMAVPIPDNKLIETSKKQFRRRYGMAINSAAFGGRKSKPFYTVPLPSWLSASDYAVNTALKGTDSKKAKGVRAKTGSSPGWRPVWNDIG